MIFYLISPFSSLKFYFVFPFGIQTYAKFQVLTVSMVDKTESKMEFFGVEPTLNPLRSTKVG